MSDIDPDVVRLIRDLLIHTDKLGFGHQARAQDIARQLDRVEKVIIDRGSVPEWMEQAPDAQTSELKYRFKADSLQICPTSELTRSMDFCTSASNCSGGFRYSAMVEKRA